MRSSMLKILGFGIVFFGVLASLSSVLLAIPMLCVIGGVLYVRFA